MVGVPADGTIGQLFLGRDPIEPEVKVIDKLVA
jgi:hypothetical protein